MSDARHEDHGPTGDETNLWTMTDAALLDRVSKAGQRVTWSQILDAAATPEQAALARRILDDEATVGPLDGLAAGARLVQSLTGDRWRLIRQAREDGASWDDIGVVLEMTSDQARDWYAGKVAEHQRYAPDYYDTARDQAILDHPTTTQPDDVQRDAAARNVEPPPQTPPTRSDDHGAQHDPDAGRDQARTLDPDLTSSAGNEPAEDRGDDAGAGW